MSELRHTIVEMQNQRRWDLHTTIKYAIHYIPSNKTNVCGAQSVKTQSVPKNTSSFLNTLEQQKDNVILWFSKILKQMKRWLDENKNKLLTLRQLCIFAARSNKKVNWTKKTTLNPKPEDLSVPPALWRLLDDNIKRTIIVLRKMHQDDKQQKANEGTAEAIDTEKKQYNGNLQTSSSSKKTDKEQPTKILQRTAQQATSVPPVAKIEIKDEPNEHFDFDFDTYDDDLQIHPVVTNCI